MTLLARMQAVHPPHRPVVGIRVAGEIDMHGGVPRCDVIGDRVDRFDPPNQRPAHDIGHAEHPAWLG